MEAESATAVPPTSSDWREAVDPRTGRTYYWNRKTRETTWSRPSEMDAKDEPDESLSDTTPETETPILVETPKTDGGQPANRVTKMAARFLPRERLSALRERLVKAGGSTEQQQSTLVKGLYLGSLLAAAAAIL